MIDDEVEVVAYTSLILASVGAAIATSDVKKRKRKHKTWVNAYIRNRDKFGTFNTLLPELCASVRTSICLSLRPSVTHWYCLKTNDRRIMQFLLSGSPGILFFLTNLGLREIRLLGKNGE